MWAHNPLLTSIVKPKRLFKKWHDRALMIDTRKTRLVIENADSDNTPVMEIENEYCSGVQEFLRSPTHNAPLIRRTVRGDSFGNYEGAFLGARGQQAETRPQAYLTPCHTSSIIHPCSTNARARKCQKTRQRARGHP